MIGNYNISFFKTGSGNNARPLLLVMAYVGLIVYFLHDYIIKDAAFYLGTLFLPYILNRKAKQLSYRYFYVTILLTGLLLVVQVTFLYYFALFFCLLFVYESYFGKSNNLPLALLFVISPLFKYLSNLFGFHIRMQLTEWAGTTLKILELPVSVEGNIIHMGNTIFSVDPACMGLQMLATGIISGLIILAYFERTTQTTTSFFLCGISCIIIIFLSFISNYIRIVLLVFFGILPENLFHDVIGLLCMGLYVITPFYFIARHYFSRKKKKQPRQEAPQKTGKYRIVLHLILLLGLINVGWQFKSNPIDNPKNLQGLELSGFNKETTSHGVLKFENSTTLIYIKPGVKFYQADHNPKVCWQGSGYNFNNISKKKCCNTEIYTAKLKKGGDTLYTAWWFDNGKIKTIDQIGWRLASVKNHQEPFHLVNITAASESILLKACRDFLTKNHLNTCITAK